MLIGTRRSIFVVRVVNNLNKSKPKRQDGYGGPIRPFRGPGEKLTPCIVLALELQVAERVPRSTRMVTNTRKLLILRSCRVPGQSSGAQDSVLRKVVDASRLSADKVEGMSFKPFTHSLRQPTRLYLGWVPLLAALEVLASPTSAASYPDQPHLLSTVAQVCALTLEQARQKYPIHLKGVITYRAPEYQVTFFQDETAGIFVWVQQSDLQMPVGSLVEVDGNTTPGDFAPSIEHARLRVLGRAALPAPRPKSLQDLLTGQEDSQWIEMSGIVHSVALEDRLPPDMRKGPRQLVLGIASGKNKLKVRIRGHRNDTDYSHPG